MSAIVFPRMAEPPSVVGRGVAYLVGGVGAGAAIGIGGSGVVMRMNANVVDHSPVVLGGSDATAAAKDIGMVTTWSAALCGAVAMALIIWGLSKGVSWLRRGGQGILAAMATVRQEGPSETLRRFAALPVKERVYRAAPVILFGVVVAVLVVTLGTAVIGDLTARWTLGDAGIGTTLLIVSVLGAVVLGVVAAAIAEMLPNRLVQTHWWWQALTGRGQFPTGTRRRF